MGPRKDLLLLFLSRWASTGWGRPARRATRARTVSSRTDRRSGEPSRGARRHNTHSVHPAARKDSLSAAASPPLRAYSEPPSARPLHDVRRSNAGAAAESPAPPTVAGPACLASFSPRADSHDRNRPSGFLSDMPTVTRTNGGGETVRASAVAGCKLSARPTSLQVTGALSHPPGAGPVLGRPANREDFTAPGLASSRRLGPVK